MTLKQKHEKGFTLVELMIVLGIIAILSTIAAYTYISAIDEIKIRGQARGLQHALNMAKMKAIATGVAHGLAFDRQSGDQPDRYMIFMDCALTGGVVGVYHDNDSNIGNNTPVTDWATCTGGGLTYDPRIREQGAVTLDNGMKFNEILGWTSTGQSDGSLEYITMTPFGQAVRSANANITSGEITINMTTESGDVLQSGVQVFGATGMVEVLPVRHL